MAPQQVKICLIIVCCLLNLTLGGHHQRRLLEYLLTERQHNPLERPVLNDSQTIPVSINLALQQLINFNGKDEIVVISGWIVLMWHAYSLTWIPEDFGNIQTIRLPSTLIWTPDVFLYNSADDSFDRTMKINAVVQHTGDVLYVPSGIFKSTCPFNIASFPFDTQHCTLKFGSWTYDVSGINLTAESDKGQLDAYVPNAEWDLEAFFAVNHAIKYDCCPDLYPFVLFTIRIRRRTLYYVTNLIVPCLLLSCMTILGFLLSPDSGEKLTLQITILLSIVMFSQLISDIMPASSTATSTISIYFMCVMCMSSISIVATVLVLSFHNRTAENHTMPLWIRKYICHYIAWLLFMKRPGHDLTWHSIRREWSRTGERQNSTTSTVGNHHHKSHSIPLLTNVSESLVANMPSTDTQHLPFVGGRQEQLPNCRGPPSLS